MPTEHRDGFVTVRGDHADGAIQQRKDEPASVGAEIHAGGQRGRGNRNSTRLCSLSRSQTATTPSSPTLASCRPSGERLAPSAHPSVALIVDTARSRSRSQTRTAPSRPAVATCLPSRLGSTEVTQSACAGHDESARDVSVACRRTFSACAVCFRSSACNARVRLRPGSTSEGLVALAASSRDAAMSRCRSASRPW